MNNFVALQLRKKMAKINNLLQHKYGVFRSHPAKAYALLAGLRGPLLASPNQPR